MLESIPNGIKAISHSTKGIKQKIFIFIFTSKMTIYNEK